MMNGASGKFILRISPSLHALLRKEAAKRGGSLNELCQRILSSFFHHGETQFETPFRSFMPQPFVQKIIDKWKENILALVIFGSVVRGEENESSDIDLLIILNEHAHLDRDLYREWDRLLEAHRSLIPHRREMSPHFVQWPRDPFSSGSLWYETALEGVILWELDSRVRALYRHIRSLIAIGAIRRAFSYGQPYWIKIQNKS